ncbi:hypothetical protein ACLOJK_009029 [Asimina triloba]
MSPITKADHGFCVGNSPRNAYAKESRFCVESISWLLGLMKHNESQASFFAVSVAVPERTNLNAMVGGGQAARLHQLAPIAVQVVALGLPEVDGGCPPPALRVEHHRRNSLVSQQLQLLRLRQETQKMFLDTRLGQQQPILPRLGVAVGEAFAADEGQLRGSYFMEGPFQASSVRRWDCTFGRIIGPGLLSSASLVSGGLPLLLVLDLRLHLLSTGTSRGDNFHLGFDSKSKESEGSGHLALFFFFFAHCARLFSFRLKQQKDRKRERNEYRQGKKG